MACGLIHLNLLARTTTKLFLVEILFLLFYKTLNLYLLFSHSYYTYLLDFYLVAHTKDHLNVRNSEEGNAVSWKRFVTLFISKRTGSDKAYFLLNALKNENKEESLTDSTFCTFELIEKNTLRKRLRISQDALSIVHLNKYGSYFKFILLLSGDINLNLLLTTLKNYILWELLPFHSCGFSTERMD